MRTISPHLVLAASCLTTGLACTGGGEDRAEPEASAVALPGTADAPPPNFVVILLDDQDELTSPYWDALPQTRALLRERGMTFTHAFAPTPICCAARASILTGKYGHNTGVLTNGGPNGGWLPFLANGNEAHTIAVYLEQAGYRTLLAGKYLNGIEHDPLHIPNGWTDWHVAVDARNAMYTGYNYTLNRNRQLVDYGDSPGDYFTDVVRGIAVDFISAEDDRPLFAFVAPTAPHLPLPPAPRHADHPWANAGVPERPNYYEPDVSDKSAWLRASAPARDKEEPFNDVDFRNRMGSLLAVDEMVADIVRAVDARGQLDNTYFILTSDNGYNLGAHHLIHKMAPYEESLRVPMVVAGPGIAAGSTQEAWALHIDIAPTILDLAGVAVPEDMDGRSLASILRGRQAPRWRSDFFAEYFGGDAANGIGAEIPPAFWYLVLPHDIPTYRALRTRRHLYVEWQYTDESSPVTDPELYDMEADPYQLDNLLATPAGRAANQVLVRTLDRRMNELATCAGAGCR